MQTSIILPFGDGEYRFCLPIKHIVEIEAKAGLIEPGKPKGRKVPGEVVVFLKTRH